MARLGLQDRLYVAVRPAGELYQASAGSNNQHLLLTMPLVVYLMSPLFAKSKNHSPFLLVSALTSPCQRYTNLAREIEETKQQQPASHLPILWLLFAWLSCACIIDKIMASTEINSLATTLIYKHHALGPMELSFVSFKKPEL